MSDNKKKDLPSQNLSIEVLVGVSDLDTVFLEFNVTPQILKQRPIKVL